MKVRNPKSRYDIKPGRRAKVLEVGGGHNPHRRSNVVVDKFVDSNYHRKTDVKVLEHQEFVNADGEALPFNDQSFDYVISNQVLEHVENPEAFLKEQMRVAPKGYIETPSIIGEYLFPKKSHKWLVLEIENKLVLVDKEKFWFKTNMDFGFLFLTWLNKTSVAYKILSKTHPNFMTVRYEWSGEIDFIVNPTEEKYLRFFNGYWNEEMVTKFFPQQSKPAELMDAFAEFVRIGIKGIKGLFPGWHHKNKSHAHVYNQSIGHLA